MQDLSSESSQAFVEWKAPHPHPQCSVRDMQEADFGSIAQVVVPALENGWKPTRDETAALFRNYMQRSIRLVESEYAIAETYGQEYAEDIQALEGIHLPVVNSDMSSVKRLLEEPDEVVWQALPADKNRTLFPDGYTAEYTDEDYQRDNLELCIEAYKRLADEERQELLSELAPYFMSGVVEEGELNHLIRAIAPDGYESMTSKQKVVFAKPFLDEFFTLNAQEVHFFSRERAGMEYTYLSPQREKLRALFQTYTDHHRVIHPWFLYLAERPNFDALRTHIGSLISPTEYPYLINAVRDILQKEELSEHAQTNMLKLGRILLGYDPESPNVEFFTSLAKLYKSIKFENYRPNLSSTHIEADIIEATAGKERGKKVLILGCGTGRHLVELESRQKGADEENIYLGLEANERHVEIARQSLGKEEQVIHGSWYDIPLEDEQVDQVESKGRDLPHVENEKGFIQVKDEVYRVLKPGGVMGFDIADPNKGEYIQHRAQFQRAMELLRVPKELREISKDLDIEYIIDGPGENEGKVYVYNRFNPKPEQVIKLMEEADTPIARGKIELPFQCVELMRAPIPGTDNENVYYIAVKPDPSELPEELHQKIEDYEHTYALLSVEMQQSVDQLINQKAAFAKKWGGLHSFEDIFKQKEQFGNNEDYKRDQTALHEAEEAMRKLHLSVLMNNQKMYGLLPHMKEALRAQVEKKKEEILAELAKKEKKP